MALTITPNRGEITLNSDHASDTPLSIDSGVTVSAGGTAVRHAR